MSNHFDPLSNPLNIQTIQEIDNLDLSIMQKHHLRILAHCLHILKTINANYSFEYQENNPLREWCDKQSKKFDDKKFSDLFYEQLESTSKKLSTFSKKIGKNILLFYKENNLLPKISFFFKFIFLALQSKIFTKKSSIRFDRECDKKIRICKW